MEDKGAEVSKLSCGLLIPDAGEAERGLRFARLAKVEAAVTATGGMDQVCLFSLLGCGRGVPGGGRGWPRPIGSV